MNSLYCVSKMPCPFLLLLLPCDNLSKLAYLELEAILTYDNRLRSTRCREFTFETMHPAYFLRTALLLPPPGHSSKCLLRNGQDSLDILFTHFCFDSIKTLKWITQTNMLRTTRSSALTFDFMLASGSFIYVNSLF